jgi:hypothetical protein
VCLGVWQEFCSTAQEGKNGVRKDKKSKFRVAVFALSPIITFSLPAGAVDASYIVRKSVAANNADWNAQPQYSHLARETKTKFGSDGQAKTSQSKTYRVTMIGGSPYYHLLELNNEPLTGVQAEQEKEKLDREIHRRQNEPPDEREARLTKYQNDRSEEHLLMQQMVDAFTFKVHREERIGGVDCYLLDAIPNPEYRPPVEKARVLLGMKGHLWVDKAEYHWVKVEAEVTRPVQFGFFIAQVKPGTSFELEQAPVGGVWLPKRFVEVVNASLLGIYGMHSRQEETYSDYQLLSAKAEPATHPGAVAAAKAVLSDSNRGGSPAH